MKLIGKIIGVFCIFYGIYTFSLTNIVQAGVSTVLCLIGIASLFADTESENLKKVRNFANRTALIISILLLIKVFILG